MWRRRHLYVLLFAVPALLVSVIAAAVMTAAAAGVLWLFVFGDNPWPPVADTLLNAFILVGGGVWVALLCVAYALGKQQEARPALNARHVAFAIGVTILLAAVIGVRLMGLDIAGTRSGDLVCADFCRAEGFAGSGMPPRDSGDRTCSCYDGQGREARRVPLAQVAPGNR